MASSLLRSVAEATLAAAQKNMTMPASSPSFASSLLAFAKVALGGVQLLASVQQPVQAATAPSCSSPQLSCHNSTVAANLCCFVAPGGQLLQTQFWDTSPPTGPADSWTIHGLWPDHCDGSYDASCDSSRQYSDISSILTAFNRTQTLSTMQKYWKDYQGDDDSFWSHEWGKHGTCISTFSPTCYSDYTRGAEAADFFDAAVKLFNTLPSYTWLAAAGITPSSSATYSSAAIQAALSAHHGHEVTLRCKGGALNEIWYHFNALGSVQTGSMVAADPVGSSNCPANGVRYLPKSKSSTTTTSTAPSKPTTTQTTSSAPGSTGVPGVVQGKGHLSVSTAGASSGCIISGGTWYTSGTCATFTATTMTDSGFTLTSSKGKCAIASGQLTCGSTVSSATEFAVLDGKLAYQGSVAFYADAVPRGTTQAKVYTTDDGHGTQLEITWQGV